MDFVPHNMLLFVDLGDKTIHCKFFKGSKFKVSFLRFTGAVVIFSVLMTD